MYELTPEEKAMFREMEESDKRVKAYNRSTHLCNGCVWAHWHDTKVFCTYSPVNCVKEKSPQSEDLDGLG